MSRIEIITDFIKKSIIPVLLAIVLYNMFIHICRPEGVTDYFRLWILCGIPFGIGKMFFLPTRGSMQFGIAMFLFNIVIGGLIGGAVLAWKILVAFWYVPLTAIRFIAEHNTNI